MQRFYHWSAGLLAMLLVGSGLVLGGASLLGVSASRLASFPQDQVLTVAIEMADEDLEDLLANGMEEKDYHATFVWNGQQFPHVSVRAKGNSSLMSVARSGTQRYSLKVDLDAYVPGQALDGIGTINLNNNFSDPTYLREYLSYEAFASLGVPTPAMTWVNLTLNGKLWGLYLAVEQIGQPYLTRHFGNGSGDLYKPANQMGQGADLKWYGDSYDAYAGIVYKTKGKNATHQALLQMLDALNNGGDLEKHLDVDRILRYLAVSTVLVDMDSYLGQFAHNYYLYEQNGRFTALPWDLNMSFAGFGMGGGQPVALKIDEPTSGALADRPLIAKLLEVPAYRERYHGYIQALIDGYLDRDRFEARAREVTALITPHVQADPTKFYTFEQFQRSLEEGVAGSGGGMFGGGAPGQMRRPPQDGQAPGGPQMNVAGMAGGNTVGLLPFVRDRVENVRQQLDGRIPSVGAGGGSGQGGFGGRFMMGGGQGGLGAPPAQGVQVPVDFQIPGGAQLPGGFQPGRGFQPPDGAQPGRGFDAPQGFQPPGGQRGRFPGGPVASPPTVAGVALDQVVPLAGALGLLLGGTLLLWRLRPRL